MPAMLEMYFRKNLRRAELFERRKTTFCFAVSERKGAAHLSVRGSAFMTAASTEMSEKQEGVYCSACAE